MPSPRFDPDLVSAIKQATKAALTDLFDTGENFYYVSLVTSGEGHCPILTAWSEQALEKILTEKNIDQDERIYFKWSYADSPYCAYGEQYFEPVKKILSNRQSMNSKMTNSDWNDEFMCRINSMELALKQLDSEGFFGAGINRSKLVVNAEVMPPDAGNTMRAKRLNPPEALDDWLQEAAEPM